MADTKNNEPLEKVDDTELDNIAGGSIGNVQYTETVDISEDTKNKV